MWQVHHYPDNIKKMRFRQIKSRITKYIQKEIWKFKNLVLQNANFNFIKLVFRLYKREEKKKKKRRVNLNNEYEEIGNNNITYKHD